MTELKKHIGKLKNTDQRCVVVFMQIPNRESHALICNVEALPPRYEQALMSILESKEAQAEMNLAHVLSRRVYQDTGKTLLEVLHNESFLQAVEVNMVIMTPAPNMPFPLRQVLEQMGRQIPEAKPNTTPNEIAELYNTDKFNQHVVNQNASKSEENLAIARNILIEADLLLQQVEQKREMAYKYAPELRPTKTVIENTVKTETKPVAKTRKPTVRKTAVKKTTA